MACSFKGKVQQEEGYILGTKRAIEIRTRKPRFDAHTGRPKNEFSVVSLAIISAWNAGKFSGDAQARLVLNLNAQQHGELASVSEVILSHTALASLLGISVASVQAQVAELAGRCGNADPAWVKANGKCKKGECICPKMLTVTKAGNVNAYSLNLANFPLAPRYVAPKPEAVPAAEAKKAPPRHFPRLAPGGIAVVDLGANPARIVRALNAATREPLDILFEQDINLSLLDVLVKVVVPETIPAHQGETKAKTQPNQQVTEMTAALNRVLKRSYGEPPADAAFAAKVAAAAPNVSPDRFAAYATAQVAKQKLEGREPKTAHLLGFARQLQAESKTASDPNACDSCRGTGIVTAMTDRGEREAKCRACGGSGTASKARGAS
jgi:hypothetical protein